MQQKKEEVKTSIHEAALEEFAASGYNGATMSAIAGRAGISVGNIYRYYSNKEKLFYQLITPEIETKLLDIISGKIDATHGEPGCQDPAYEERLIEFLVAYRRELLILLEGAADTRFAAMREHMLGEMVSLCKSCQDGSSVDHTILNIAYDNLLRGIAVIFRKESIETKIGTSLQNLLAYHVQGIGAIM